MNGPLIPQWPARVIGNIRAEQRRTKVARETNGVGSFEWGSSSLKRARTKLVSHVNFI